MLFSKVWSKINLSQFGLSGKNFPGFFVESVVASDLFYHNNSGLSDKGGPPRSCLSDYIWSNSRKLLSFNESIFWDGFFLSLLKGHFGVSVYLQSFLDNLGHFTLDSLIIYRPLPFKLSLLFSYNYGNTFLPSAAGRVELQVPKGREEEAKMILSKLE